MTVFSVYSASASGIGTLGQALNDSFNDANGDADTIGLDPSVVTSISDLGGATLRSAVTLDASTAQSISADIAGSGSLAKAGQGTLTLSGDNTYAGTTTVAAGVLQVSSDGNLGAGTVTIASGATLLFEISGGVTFDNTLAGTGTLEVLGAFSQLSLTGANGSSQVAIYANYGANIEAGDQADLGHGAITLHGGSLSVTSGSFDNSLTVIDNGGFSAIIYVQGDVELAGDIIGSGLLAVRGSGARILSGDNSAFTGLLQLQDGVTILANNTAVGAGTQAATMSDATLRLTDGIALTRAIEIDSRGGAIELLSGQASSSGAIDIQSSATITVDTGASLTLSGALSGAGMPSMFSSGDPVVDKAGSGTLTLSGISTYTVDTHVLAGTLVVNGTIVSAVSVDSGATLGGTGTINADVSVNGTLAAGQSPGVLHTGNLLLNGGATFAVEMGGTVVGDYDQIDVAGTVTVGGALSLSLVNSFSPTSSASFIIIDNDGTTDLVTGTFTSLAEGATVSAGGVNFKISYVGGDGNDVALTFTGTPTPPTPEPEQPVNLPTDASDVLTTPAWGGIVAAGLGDDRVTGDIGADDLQGNQGNDTLHAGGGADTVRGGQGEDFVHGNQGEDKLFGDLGGDTLSGGKGQDWLQGNQGDDLLLGDLGDDTILGGQGHDVIHGGDGIDYLSGDLGSDVLTGGAGADIFNFSGRAGHDVITDFSRAQGDLIRLSAADAADFAALVNKISAQGADTVITLGAEVIVMTGVASSSLTASDFVFV